MSTSSERSFRPASAGLVPRPPIAVYVHDFLTPSMTFVHRQLLGVSSRFDPFVLAVRRANQDRFAFEPVFAASPGRAGLFAGRLVARWRGRSFALPPLAERRWRELLRDRRVALLHAHFGPGGIELLPLTEALGIPLLVTFHGYDASRLLRDARYVRDLHHLLRTARGITVSEEMRQRLIALGLPAERLVTHHIGVPLDCFPRADRTPPAVKAARGEPLRLLQVSNFVEKKGHEWTVRAFARLRAQRRDVGLVLAGDGPLRAATEALARELGVADAISFPGSVRTPEVAALMQSADVFVHHSVTAADGDMEGIPTVVMEAMATGLPVVTTRHSGIPELVQDGETGFLVAERDVDSYVAALESALGASPEIGAAAARFVREHFDIEKQNDRLADVYDDVLRRGGRL